MIPRAGRHSNMPGRAGTYRASVAASYSRTPTRAARHSYGNDGNGSRLLYFAVAAAILVFACWWMWLRPTAATPETGGPVGRFPAFEEAPRAANRGRGLIETFEVFAPKDPFAPAAGKGSAGPDGGSHRVRLVSAGSGGAEVQIDGTVHSVASGEVFAGTFKLISTSRRCATILYGDDQFSLCRGQEVTK